MSPDGTGPLGEMIRWFAVDPYAPPLAALATVDADGLPRCRHVLVTGVDDEGPRFHTDSRSGKIADLASTPAATLCLVTDDRTRQLSVTGEVRRTGALEQREAYARRRRYLQILAWENDAHARSLPLRERRARWAERDRLLGPDPLPPPTWVGYVLSPRTVTFWEGHEDAPSQRRRYVRDRAGWTTTDLPG